MKILNIIIIILLVLILFNKQCKEKFEDFFQPMFIQPILRGNYYSPVPCMTKGHLPETCSCRYEDYKKGNCPSACSLTRDREPLISQQCIGI